MKKAFLSMAFLGLLAVGTTYAQDQDKNKKNDKSKTEQPADMKSDEVKTENPDNSQQKLSNDQQKANEDQQKQYDPNQQPAQTQPAEPVKSDTVVPQ